MQLPPPPGAGPESTGTAGEEHEVARDASPRIYVASLSDYNADNLHGTWIAADQEPDELLDSVQNMLDESPSADAEEFAVHDYEGFGEYQVNEYDSLNWISRVARGITEHGLPFASWVDNADRDADLAAQFEEAYRGEWDSVAAYAEELLSDLGYEQAMSAATPDWLQPYVKLDVEAFGRDLMLGGDIVAVNHPGGVWIFEGRQ